jgi:tRNA(Ile2) C34 agmatinyltransferase TiaS
MKKIDPKDNASNQVNPNKRTDGTNEQYDQVHGNRGKQLNPNNKPSCPTCGSTEVRNGSYSGYTCLKCYTAFK